jgi:desulfoferrodoxin-like iron-binding protein
VQKIKGDKIMTKKAEVYECEICGNVVAVIKAGDGDLVCCGEEMKLVSGERSKEFYAGLPKVGAL